MHYGVFCNYLIIGAACFFLWIQILSRVTFFQPEELTFNIFCKAGWLAAKFLSCVYLGMSLFPPHF